MRAHTERPGLISTLISAAYQRAIWRRQDAPVVDLSTDRIVHARLGRGVASISEPAGRRLNP